MILLLKCIENDFTMKNARFHCSRFYDEKALDNDCFLNMHRK